MTIQEERTYVEAAWEHPALQSLEKAGFNKNGSMTKLGMIHAAYLFTVERKEQIRQAEMDTERVKVTRNHALRIVLRTIETPDFEPFVLDQVRDLISYSRILAREQQRLADLRKGMKGGE